jgi:hypothetical protein
VSDATTSPFHVQGDSDMVVSHWPPVRHVGVAGRPRARAAGDRANRRSADSPCKADNPWWRAYVVRWARPPGARVRRTTRKARRAFAPRYWCGESLVNGNGVVSGEAAERSGLEVKGDSNRVNVAHVAERPSAEL